MGNKNTTGSPSIHWTSSALMTHHVCDDLSCEPNLRRWPQSLVALEEPGKSVKVLLFCQCCDNNISHKIIFREVHPPRIEVPCCPLHVPVHLVAVLPVVAGLEARCTDP